MKLKFKRKPRFGVWRLGIHYPHYPFKVNKIIIRYPENWYGVEELIKKIQKLIEKEK